MCVQQMLSAGKFFWAVTYFSWRDRLVEMLFCFCYFFVGGGENENTSIHFYSIDLFSWNKSAWFWAFSIYVTTQVLVSLDAHNSTEYLGIILTHGGSLIG